MTRRIGSLLAAGSALALVVTMVPAWGAGGHAHRATVERWVQGSGYLPVSTDAGPTEQAVTLTGVRDGKHVGGFWHWFNGRDDDLQQRVDGSVFELRTARTWMCVSGPYDAGFERGPGLFGWFDVLVYDLHGKQYVVAGNPRPTKCADWVRAFDRSKPPTGETSLPLRGRFRWSGQTAS